MNKVLTILMIGLVAATSDPQEAGGGAAGSRGDEEFSVNLPIWRQCGPEELVHRAKQVLDYMSRKTADDQTRPVFHFRSPAQWMNDVCAGRCVSPSYTSSSTNRCWRSSSTTAAGP